MAVSQTCLRCLPAVYDQQLHEWFLSRQAKKYRKAQEDMLRYFGALTCGGMNEAVARMQRALGDGVNVCAATMYVLFCECRQAVNHYTLKTVCYMVEKYQGSAKLQELVSEGRAVMLASDDVCKPHTLQVLEIIRKYLGKSPKH